MVWVAWFGILQHREHRKPRVQEVVTESRGLLKAPSATYILSERVDTYASPPHFKREAAVMAGFRACRTLSEELLPVLTAPRPCQLCGDGFVEWSDLGKHVDTKHINWAEYRKRVFWHAQYETADPCDALPLSWAQKRRANAATQLVSAPAQTTKVAASGARQQRHPRAREREPRALVGCAVCATKEWSERMRRCYLFRSFPLGEETVREDLEAQDAALSEASDESEGEARRKPQRQLLQDKAGILYCGAAEDVQKFLSVESYAARWPCIPVEELHASSVQHPAFPASRWLLHTRRVPVQEEADSAGAGSGSSAAETEDCAVVQEQGAGVAEDVRPPCAGVGDANATVVLCRWCAQSLCHHKPALPKRALANDMWGS